MKRAVLTFAACLALLTPAWAAGVTKTTEFTVLESRLGGYKATPWVGLTQDYVVTLAAEDVDASNLRFVAVIASRAAVPTPTAKGSNSVSKVVNN